MHKKLGFQLRHVSSNIDYTTRKGHTNGHIKVIYIFIVTKMVILSICMPNQEKNIDKKVVLARQGKKNEGETRLSKVHKG